MKQTKDPYSNEAQMTARIGNEWYDTISSTVTKCPFCDLKAKYLVKDWDNCVLTVNTFPYIDGHLMVVPKRHVERLTDLNKKEWAEAQELLSKGMDVLRKHFEYVDFNILYREGGKDSGSSLKHLHIHIIPTRGLLTYRLGGFNFDFQKINFPPVETADKLRQLYN